MDPPGSVPIFLALTGGMTAAQRARAAWPAVVLAGGVIVCFAVAGRQVLAYLGIAIRPTAWRSSAPPGTCAGPGPI
jgi:multiple antibiotic resistance protein